MKLTLLVIVVLVMCVTLFGNGRSIKPDEERNVFIDSAQTFLERLLNEDFEAAASGFDETMSRVMPAEKLQQTWETVLKQAGAFQERTGFRRERTGGYESVFLTCAFEKALLDIRVVFDAENRIAGLFFTPAQSPYFPPQYTDPLSFRELDVVVGSGEWTLPGTLTLPRSRGPHPALVLVHGSGPNDRDETIGPNKPFKDLACGLAAHGIAVLRYDKRTKVHREKMTAPALKLTVYEETIEDAALAAALLRAREDIQADRVFILGHSLGGMLVPRIAAAVPEAAGFVVWAGAASPLEDSYVRQLEYIFGLDRKIDAEEEKQMEESRAVRDRIKALAPPDAGGKERILGARPAYWLDLRGYHPPTAAKAVDRPMLVQQGGRDYQVTPQEFEQWRAALGGRDDVRLELYPSLNHLFIAGTGPSTPAEYQRSGHVAIKVIKDIAAWILTFD